MKKRSLVFVALVASILLLGCVQQQQEATTATYATQATISATASPQATLPAGLTQEDVDDDLQDAIDALEQMQ